jgi:hypothetical protein
MGDFFVARFRDKNGGDDDRGCLWSTQFFTTSLMRP